MASDKVREAGMSLSTWYCVAACRRPGEATVMFGSESTIEKSVTGGTILSLVTSSASWTLRPTRGVPVASEIVFT